MRITNAEVIKSGEKDLIDSITADLDWGAIEDIFLTEHNLGIDEDIEYKRGDIIAYNNQVAYRLEFAVKVNLSILINREGEYLSVKISEKKDNAEPDITGEEINGTVLKESLKKELTEHKEDPFKANEGLSGDNAENPYVSNAAKNEEDRYLEALGKLGAGDSNENAVDAIR